MHARTNPKATRPYLRYQMQPGGSRRERRHAPDVGQGPEQSCVVSPVPPQDPAAHAPSQAAVEDPSALYEPGAQAAGVAEVAAAAQ
jgi:hypothetical protein